MSLDIRALQIITGSDGCEYINDAVPRTAPERKGYAAFMVLEDNTVILSADYAGGTGADVDLSWIGVPLPAGALITVDRTFPIVGIQLTGGVVMGYFTIIV